ncbi:MAG TPA: DUF3187 family protein [Thermoanaerobaculaceae bacterium]|nr:DUF3187 family protein [Thermoanaerobaculaceae bacterium]
MRIVAAALLLGSGAAAQDVSDWNASQAVGLGPLRLRAQSPLAILRLTPTPETPVTLRDGQWQLGLLTSWNNYFDVDPQRYTIDAETLRFTLSAAYGVTPDLELRAALPVSYRGGGILDRFIENFEGLLKVPNEERKRAPRNRYLILIRGSDGQVFERSGGDAGWGIEDATAGVRYLLARGTASTPAVTASFTLKLPAGRTASLFSSGGYDVAAGVSAGQRLGRFNLYGSLVAMHYATTELAGVRLKPNQLSYFAGLEYRVSPGSSWLVQALVTSPGAENFGDFSKNTYEITAGWKHLVSRAVLVEVSVLENLLIFDNSPDVGFHVGLVWRSAPR